MTQHSQDIHLDVVATLAGAVIDVRLLEQKAQADLERGIREMHAQGVAVENLAAASGLPVAQVQRIVATEQLSAVA